MKKTNAEKIENMLYIMRTHSIVNDEVDVDHITGTVICLTDGQKFDAASEKDYNDIIETNNNLYFWKLLAEAKSS